MNEIEFSPNLVQSPDSKEAEIRLKITNKYHYLLKQTLSTLVGETGVGYGDKRAKAKVTAEIMNHVTTIGYTEDQIDAEASIIQEKYALSNLATAKHLLEGWHEICLLASQSSVSLQLITPAPGSRLDNTMTQIIGSPDSDNLVVDFCESPGLFISDNNGHFGLLVGSKVLAKLAPVD